MHSRNYSTGSKHKNPNAINADLLSNSDGEKVSISKDSLDMSIGGDLSSESSQEENNNNNAQNTNSEHRYISFITINHLLIFIEYRESTQNIDTNRVLKAA